LVIALSSEASGASAWTLARQAQKFMASMVQEVPSPVNAGDTDMYRLTIVCDANTHEAEIKLAWAPGGPPSGQVMSASVDGKKPLPYKIEGGQKMGNEAGTSGPGAVILAAAHLPQKTLTVNNVLPNETVVFPFSKLAPAARQELSACFTSASSKPRPESARATGPAVNLP
jgi:hypothetical protein